MRYKIHFSKPKKQTITVRIDVGVLQSLKSQGKGYQTRLNHILRQNMIEKSLNLLFAKWGGG